jgi:EPS-associated MarR family transcriptional regulator
MLTDEYRYRILKLLDSDPEMSQRQLARELDISLGRVNYCLQALIEKGFVKVGNFRNSNDKRAYLYMLTPSGIKAKAKITLKFLKVKIAEYETLRKEVSDLRREAASLRRQ